MSDTQEVTVVVFKTGCWLLSDLIDAAISAYSPRPDDLARATAHRAALAAIDTWDSASGVSLPEWIHLAVLAALSTSQHVVVPALSQARH
jgi:hypothetical protein